MTRAQADQILGALTRISHELKDIKRLVLAQGVPQERPQGPGHPFGGFRAPQQQTLESTQFDQDPFQTTQHQALTDEVEAEIEQSLRKTLGASSHEVCTAWRESDEREAVEEEIRLFQDRRASRVLTVPRMDPDEGGP